MTPAAANLDWLYHTLGWTLAAAGVGLLMWALFWDRSRGRRRCPKCWYSMEGVPWLRCPECGREAKGERAFARTRRRWRIAAAAILLLLAASPVWSVSRIRSEGWIGAVPTSVLVFIAPIGGPDWEAEISPGWRVFSPPRGSLLDRAIARAKKDRIWRWQRQVLLNRVFAAHPGEILHALGVPTTWPSGVEIRLRLNPGYTYGYCPEQPGIKVRVHGSGRAWAGWNHLGAISADSSSIGLVEPGKNTTELDVELLSSSDVVWTGRVRPPLQVKGVMDDYMKGVEPRDMKEQIAGRDPRLSFLDDSEVYLQLDTDGKDHSGPNCTLAVDVDVIRNGVRVGRASLYRFNINALTVFTGAWTSTMGSRVHWADPKATFGVDDARWEIRFTPNESLAMRDYVADTKSSGHFFNECVNTYWNGDLTVPVRVERFKPRSDPNEFK